jgi:hypothetical protein
MNIIYFIKNLTNSLVSIDVPFPGRICRSAVRFLLVVKNFLVNFCNWKRVFGVFFEGLDCVGLSFASVSHFVFFARWLDSHPELP